MQFMKFLSLLPKRGLSNAISAINSLLQKRGLSYAISRISFSSPETWTIICNFLNIFLFSKNMVYHMQFLEFISLLQKRGLSYAISRNFFSSPKTWIIIYNF